MITQLKIIIGKTLDIALIVILAAMSVLVAVNVFFRFILNSSIYWGDEVALVLMVWLTFLGAAVAIRDKSHYVFTYLINKLQGLPLKIFVYTRDFINLAVIVILGFYSGQAAIEIHSWILPATEISRAYVYAAAPIGSVFMLHYSAEQLFNDIKRFNSKP